MQEKEIVISNKLGLHARAAAKFVSIAGHYACEIDVFKGEQKVNGKSIMGVMMLAASKGTPLKIRTDGEDEKQAMDELCKLIKNNFNEEE